ncbi:hypothetical protein EDD18DRAFT_1334714 [Armillaria luteobubalina]|uniref:Uncharacterized protein n=1 Tax=Armillaria luteobubalina TaxID=153913 RepID=A0AA39PTZ7_9AGAR|nr:hypothetical protein EDD18DRAFT_1334714 [Armillaria luteobubalina]
MYSYKLRQSNIQVTAQTDDRSRPLATKSKLAVPTTYFSLLYIFASSVAYRVTSQRWMYVPGSSQGTVPSLRLVTVHRFGVMAYAINPVDLRELTTTFQRATTIYIEQMPSSGIFLPYIATMPNAPPAFASMGRITCHYPPLGNGYRHAPEFFETASNAAFLHKDLMPLVLDNASGV